jgi:hypothetical protein
MELYLPDSSGQDRKYVVKYNFYSMTRREAEEYMMSLEASARDAPAAAVPNPGSEGAPPPGAPSPATLVPRPSICLGSFVGSTNPEGQGGTIAPQPPSLAHPPLRLPLGAFWKTQD